MYMCIYMYIFIFVYLYVYVYIFTCIHICLDVYLHTYICIYIYMYISCAHTYIYICIFIYTYIYIHMHTYMCIHTCIYTRIYVHMCTCMYIYIHTYRFKYLFISCRDCKTCTSASMTLTPTLSSYARASYCAVLASTPQVRPKCNLFWGISFSFALLDWHICVISYQVCRSLLLYTRLLWHFNVCYDIFGQGVARSCLLGCRYAYCVKETYIQTKRSVYLRGMAQMCYTAKSTYIIRSG